MKNKRKLVTSGIALALVAVLALTGTLAWQSISQRALGEKQSPLNPGGRLHDDFDGTNRDIYVENFSGGNYGTNIYARVRLDEYMEIGEDAGQKNPKTQGTSTPQGTKVSKPVVDEGTANIDDLSTWRTRKSTTSDKITDYWKLDLDGGKTVYMPTFNMNKDSLVADINGTYDGKYKDDDKHYDDYVQWKKDEKKSDYEVEDADDNDFDEVAAGTSVDGVNIKTSADKVEHTAKETKESAKYVTMAEWLEKPDTKKKGNYWVWDEDGWFYWANPIAPGETTGLLLDGIELQNNDDLTQRWYYGLNVVAQFVTKDDLGKTKEELGAEKGTGFYDLTQSATEPTDNAIKLLETIGAKSTVVDEIRAIDINHNAGSSETVTLDGMEWYVLAEDKATDQALLLSKDVVTTGTWSSGDGTEWANSTVKQTLNSTWLADKKEINANISKKSGKTEVLVLSQADVFGEGTDFTAGAKLTAPGRSWKALNSTPEAASWVLSTTYMDESSNHYVYCVAADGTKTSVASAKATVGVRPAFWFDLSPED